MTSIKSFAFVVGAAELLSKGVDISVLDRRRFVDREEFAEGTEYHVKVDKPTQEMFGLDSDKIIRRGAIVISSEDKNFEANISLSLNKVKQIMQVLWEAEIESFSDFDEKDFVEGYEEVIKKIDAGYDRNLEMKSKLSRTNTDTALTIFLALFNYAKGYSKKLYDDSKVNKDFNKLLKIKTDDFDILDNRLYIYFKPSDMKKIDKYMRANNSAMTDDMRSMKAFVISKNVYDYFWASYGNKFQSCFSLNSEYGYLYGYVPFAMADESFICYATTGGTNKIPIISGKQFQCPNMLWRCWGYADTVGDLLLDKRYKDNSSYYQTFIEACINVLKTKISAIDDSTSCSGDRDLYNLGQGIRTIHNELDGYFYSDSLRKNDSKVYFRFAGGMCGTGRVKAPWQETHRRFTTYASTITAVSDTLTLDKKCAVVNGVLLNPKRCPVTGFMISDTDTKSPYAKYYTKDCKESCVLTYIDGCVFCDASTMDMIDTTFFKISASNDRNLQRNFNSSRLKAYGYSTGTADDYKCISLKSLKEHIKGHISSTGLDGILLRYFEGSEIKYQFFKG